MITASQAAAKYILPITKYVNLGKLQKILLRIAVTSENDMIAATRLLSLLAETEVNALLLNSVQPSTTSNFNESQKSILNSLQNLLEGFRPLQNTVRTALGESKDFLPKFTVDALREYNTVGAPLERLAVVSFMILTANLQA